MSERAAVVAFLQAVAQNEYNAVDTYVCNDDDIPPYDLLISIAGRIEKGEHLR